MREMTNNNDKRIRNQKEILNRAEILSNNLIAKTLLYSIENVKNKNENEAKK